MKLFLGIDGGQSSTTAAIGDEKGHVLGSGRGGPCNHVGTAEGRKNFLEAVGGCVDAACAEAGLERGSITFEVVCAGFSGGPEDKEACLRDLVPARQIIVTIDPLVALAGGTGGGPGIITIAGTGSISWGRNAERKVARVGGWGYIFGDEGSAFDFTRQALRAVLRHEEGWGPPTVLRELLLAATGASHANDLLHRFYTADFPRPKIASYSKLVDRAAADGDPVARNIVLNAAQQLATCTSAVRTQLFIQREPVNITYTGGVFKSEMLLERFRLLVELEDGNGVIAPLYGPATGALIEAYAAAGLNPSLMNVPAEKY